MKPVPLKDFVPLSISGVVPGQIAVLHLNDHAAVLKVQCKASLWWVFRANRRCLLTWRSSAKSPMKIASTSK